LLDTGAKFSAPIVGAAGDIVDADDTVVVHFDANGNVIWKSQLPSSGNPISPILVNNGQYIFIATTAGPVSAFSADTGALIGSYQITGPNDSGTQNYVTRNTPCTQGHRVYVLVEGVTNNRYGMLTAIDLVPVAANPLRLAWQTDGLNGHPAAFGGPSGASPTLVSVNLQRIIYFDGASLTSGDDRAGFVFAVRDNGPNATLVFSRDNLLPIKISGSVDLGGTCIWFTGVATGVINCYDLITGNTHKTINLNALGIDANNQAPSAALTAATGIHGEHLIVTGSGRYNPAFGTGYVICLNADTSALVWKWQLNSGEATVSQYPIVSNQRIGAPSASSGIYIIGN
jgi:hypothetical protein